VYVKIHKHKEAHMKLALTILLALILNAAAFGLMGGTNESTVNESTVKSLLVGLKSENLGLKTGSAYMIGELKLTEAIIPLMKLLREDESEKVRISAALALYKIGTPMSIYAVKQASKYDSSERVVKLAYGFYNEFLRNKMSYDENIEDSTHVASK
jgi:HEAT repeats